MVSKRVTDNFLVARTEGRLRAMALIEAAERASLTPIPIERLHSLAYLADVLSPVWGLEPFDKAALKTEQAPFFATFQAAVDILVLEGMIEVSDFAYEHVSAGNIKLKAKYASRYDDPFVNSVLSFLYEDEIYSAKIEYFTALAIAMSRLPDSEIEYAASKDAAWENPDVPIDNLVDITNELGAAIATPTTHTIDYFGKNAVGGVRLGRASNLRLYASYLGQRLKAA
jgi:hypothetical protein